MIYSKCNTADSQHSDLSFQLNADSFPKQIHEQGKAFFILFRKHAMTDVGWSCCVGRMGYTCVSIFQSLPY